MSDFNVAFFSSDEEKRRRDEFLDLLKNCPIPDSELLDNLGLFLNSKLISRLKFMDYIYQQIVDVHGVVFDLGTRWGQNAAYFSELRGIYEPYNRMRKIVAFDTFAGFPSVAEQDGNANMMKKGNYSVSENYDNYLDSVMKYHEKENPISHVKKYELVKGDATVTVPQYLEDNPETIIALAYFDFDLYDPTKICLEAIKNRLVKGSIVGFDELNDHVTPGETVALMEVMGLNNISLKRLRYTSRASYFVVE